MWCLTNTAIALTAIRHQPNAEIYNLPVISDPLTAGQCSDTNSLLTMKSTDVCIQYNQTDSRSSQIVARSWTRNGCQASYSTSTYHSDGFRMQAKSFSCAAWLAMGSLHDKHRIAIPQAPI